MFAFCCCHCQAKLRVKEDLAGKRIRCPSCKQFQQVAAPAPAEAVTAAGQADHAEDVTVPPLPQPGADLEGATLPSVHAAVEVEDETPRRSVAEVLAEKPSEGPRYEAQEEIGRGGMGMVRRAVDCEICREVAIKYLLNQADASQKTRFVEEAQITGQLEHPNIVPIHELGVDGEGNQFFSMKMVKGRSLAQVLAQLRAADQATLREYTLGRLLTISNNIGNALAYAHSRGVIHRDLKPANIMLGDFGEVYVMDWGLAKILGRQETPAAERVAIQRSADASLTQAGSILGTPAYMPPEQARGDLEAIDPRSDIYSLGAILYEILTLTPPVGREGDQIDILIRVAEGAIAPPEQQAPERARQGLIPPELSAVALKALAREPGQRYQRVEELQRDIQLFLEGRSVSAKRDTAWELFKKLLKRNKGVSVATAASLAVLAVVVGFFLKINYDARLFAETQQQKAEKAYEDYLQEQAAKRQQARKSAPAFLRAAQLLIGEMQFADALPQVELALDYDAEQTRGLLVKGQLLIGLERYAEAVAPLEEYVKRQPTDQLAKRLAALAARPAPTDAAYFWALYDVFQKQKALTLADRMTHLAETFAGPQKQLLVTYQKRIDTAWPGLGKSLTLDKNGRLHLDFTGRGLIRELTPLTGMKLATLSLRGTTVQDIAPLEGMPLTALDLKGCGGIKDLRPLQGMRLSRLDLGDLWAVRDLGPLRDMPLTELNLAGCREVASLEPLRGMPLTRLYLANAKVRDLGPLRDMKLKALDLGSCKQVADITPLEGMPLEWLNLSCYESNIRNYEPLRGLPLKYLNLYYLPIRDLSVLSKMPLQELDLGRCGNVRDLGPLHAMKLWKLVLGSLRELTDLEPLRGMPLADFHAADCPRIKDWSVLKDMPLQWVSLPLCPQLRDLEFLRGKKLQFLDIEWCQQLHDLSPLAGMPLRRIVLTPRFIRKESMDLLRAMNLDSIDVAHDRRFAPADFWRLYDRGEFKK